MSIFLWLLSVFELVQTSTVLCKRVILMNTAIKLILLAIALLVISTVAIARDSHRSSSITFGYNSQYSGPTVHFTYSNQRKYHHQRYYSYTPYSTRSYGNNHSYHRHSYNNHYRKACHPVSKTIIDHYGQHKYVSGTQCYNRYGQPYIVRGSRFLRH